MAFAASQREFLFSTGLEWWKDVSHQPLEGSHVLYNYNSRSNYIKALWPFLKALLDPFAESVIT